MLSQIVRTIRVCGVRGMCDGSGERCGLSCEDIHTMMVGGYSQGKTLGLLDEYEAKCLDQNVWEIWDENERVVATINPTNARTCIEVVSIIAQILDGENTRSSRCYPEAASSD